MVDSFFSPARARSPHFSNARAFRDVPPMGQDRTAGDFWEKKKRGESAPGRTRKQTVGRHILPWLPKFRFLVKFANSAGVSEIRLRWRRPHTSLAGPRDGGGMKG